MRIKESVTLTDVAKIAGVSQSTVSRVLNNHSRINKATRHKVLEAVNTLGYDTSSLERKALGRAAATSTDSLTLELLMCPLPEQKNMLNLNFYNEVFTGIQLVLNHLEYIRHNLCTWNVDMDGNQAHNEKVFQRLQRSDGVLILGNPPNELIERIIKNKIKVVLISTGQGRFPLDVVESDNVTGGMLAARYLIDRGFKKIAYLNGSDTVQEWKSRKAGIMIETAECLGYNAFSCRNCASTELVDVMKTFKSWLESDDRPEAIILPYADSIIGIEMVLEEKNLKCPEDISIVAFDRLTVNSFYIKPVCFDVFPRKIGKKAALRLLQILDPHNLDSSHHRIVVPLELVPGNSVKENK